MRRDVLTMTFLSVAWSVGFNMYFLAPVFQWYCLILWGSPGVTIRFCQVLISDSI